jgi:hypothetical protein
LHMRLAVVIAGERLPLGSGFQRADAVLEVASQIRRHVGLPIDGIVHDSIHVAARLSGDPGWDPTTLSLTVGYLGMGLSEARDHVRALKNAPLREPRPVRAPSADEVGDRLEMPVRRGLLDRTLVLCALPLAAFVVYAGFDLERLTRTPSGFVLLGIIAALPSLVFVILDDRVVTRVSSRGMTRRLFRGPDHVLVPWEDLASVSEFVRRGRRGFVFELEGAGSLELPPGTNVSEITEAVKHLAPPGHPVRRYFEARPTATSVR